MSTMKFELFVKGCSSIGLAVTVSIFVGPGGLIWKFDIFNYQKSLVKQASHLLYSNPVQELLVPIMTEFFPYWILHIAAL